MNIREFCQIAEVDLRITYFSIHDNFGAKLNDCEIKDHKHTSILSGTEGYGKTPKEAVNNMIEMISNKHLVVNATSEKYRRELGIPKISKIK